MYSQATERSELLLTWCVTWLGVAGRGVRRSGFAGPRPASFFAAKNESVTMVASDGPSQASFHDLETHRPWRPSPSCTRSSAQLIIAKIWKVETLVVTVAGRKQLTMFF
jgi:hypothetical protein